jgi:hypothetical protein
MFSLPRLSPAATSVAPQQIELGASLFNGQLRGLGRFCGIGCRGLLVEEEQNAENERQHVDSLS